LWKTIKTNQIVLETWDVMYIPDTPIVVTIVRTSCLTFTVFIRDITKLWYLVQNPNIHQYSLTRKPLDPVM